MRKAVRFTMTLSRDLDIEAIDKLFYDYHSEVESLIMIWSLIRSTRILLIFCSLTLMNCKKNITTGLMTCCERGDAVDCMKIVH